MIWETYTMPSFSNAYQEHPVISVVAFHMDVPEAISRQIRDVFTSVTLLPPHQILEALIGSVSRAMPACEKFILTDESTLIPANIDAQILRFPLPSDRLMESRMFAWRNFLLQNQGHVLFLDSDILVQADLTDIFRHPFDAALTYRHEMRWPINAGVVGFHAERPKQRVDFMDRCIHIYRTKYSHAGAWGGDQDALREMVAGVDLRQDDVFHARTNGFDILFLPCAHYNFSTSDEAMDGDYPDKAILHYKGRRKYAMLPAWQRIQTANEPIKEVQLTPITETNLSS
jgi:hypothetical protein